MTVPDSLPVGVAEDNPIAGEAIPRLLDEGMGAYVADR